MVGVMPLPVILTHHKLRLKGWKNVSSMSNIFIMISRVTAKKTGLIRHYS